MTNLSTVSALDTMTKADLFNVLVTQNEQATILHDAPTAITYQRLNHLPYSYHISLRTPGAVKKKVIVRLWLGLASDVSELR